MKTNQTARVLELLKRFNDGKTINIQTLLTEPLWEGKSEKTLRRDLDVIKEYFPESFERVKGVKGTYRAVTKEMFDNFIDKKMLSLLVIAYNLADKNRLFESFEIDEIEKNLLKSKLKSSDDCYEFITKPFEDKKVANDLLKNLEFAIKYKRKLKVTYNAQEDTKDFTLNPYKIVFINENFYLSCESEYGFTMLRVQNITNVDVKKETFRKNFDIVDFIKTIQTPFAKYTEDFRKNMIHVKLQISKEKSRFFKLKKFFASQKIEKTNEDGSVIVAYTFTQISEILTFVLSWLPHAKVLEPKELKDEIDDILKKATC